jgi:hypothetical protein
VRFTSLNATRAMPIAAFPPEIDDVLPVAD